MAMPAGRITYAAEARAKAENQRRMILGALTPGEVLSIDEITFRTKLQRHDVVRRLNCEWFETTRWVGRKPGRYKLSPKGVYARKRGVHLQQVHPVVRPPSLTRVSYQLRTSERAREEGREYWQQQDVDAPYVPTEEQIREACLEVQATWSEQERYSRRTYLSDALGTLE